MLKVGRKGADVVASGVTEDVGRMEFLLTLRRAWDRAHPAMETVTAGSGPESGSACVDDACGI